MTLVITFFQSEHGIREHVGVANVWDAVTIADGCLRAMVLPPPPSTRLPEARYYPLVNIKCYEVQQ